MEKNNLVEKLSLQVESFQEGFEILCKSFNLNEMVKNFLHIIRGNFIVTEIYSFHKLKNNSGWNNLSLMSVPDSSYLIFLKDSEKPTIEYFSDQKVESSITLPLADQSYLGILIGHKLDKSKFTDFDKITLQILLQVFDSAYKSFLNQKKEKALIFELNEKVLQLNNLIDTGIELSRYDNQSVLFELALGRIVVLTNASSALIIISDIKTNLIEIQITFPKNISSESILSNPYKIESSFDFNNKRILFILSEKETRKGAAPFNDLDSMLLNAVSRQVRASLENEYLLGQSLEKERIEKELNLAAAIQQKIIPEELPKIAGYQLAGINIPSREVGGDYYDCFDLGKGKYALIMADVAGKGISAALLVSTLNAALHSYLEFGLPLTDLADKLNKLIYKASPPDKYITFFIALLDSKSGTLGVLNAGHNPALLLRKDGTLVQIEAGGIGLGMLDLGIPYTGQTLSIDSGDKLFLYTDGIPEAMNENEEEYSEDKMINFFTEHSEKPVDVFIDMLVKDVKVYAGTTPQSDDITALILKRN